MPRNKGGDGVSISLYLVPLILIILLCLPVMAHASDDTLIRGVVMDSFGNPVAGAEITLLNEGIPGAINETGPDGIFHFETDTGGNYSIYVVGDLASTPGVDFVPTYAEISMTEEAIVVLQPGASAILTGDIQFVDTVNLPTSTLYTVMNADDEIIDISGIPLIYGTTLDALTHALGLDERHLIVPAGLPFRVQVNTSILVGKEVESRSFNLQTSQGFDLTPGSVTQLDLREHVLPVNLDLLEETLAATEETLNEMAGLGFYVAAERRTLETVTRHLSEASSLFSEGSFVESFDVCKIGFIDVTEALGRLSYMNKDASLSVYTITSFLVIASTTAAFLLADKDRTKVLGSLGFSALSLGVLFVSYPGSTMVQPESFLLAGIVSLMISLGLAIFLPRFMKARGGDGHLPVRNIVVPIFSIAKRSMRRRKLRFALTLVSITVLVVSFVSLTSFSEGYGLIVKRVSTRTEPGEVVLIRSQGFTEFDHASIHLTDQEADWLERQRESVVVSPKAENPPMLRPEYRMGGARIHGILGIDGDLESDINPIRDMLIEGELPDEDGVAITRVLRDELGLSLGDTLYIGQDPLTLVGVFDYSGLSGLRELDGAPFLPMKLVNLDPEAEQPQIVARPCEANEFIVVHISKALDIPLVGVSRVALSLSEDADAEVFAERLALERDYQAWFASVDGVYLARLGTYLEGKGLPLLVPWVIVILNVVMTMLNSMFERRKEIHILSSVGLNPAQIAAIFIAEATIIGLIAGGLGYLGGLGVYRVMAYVGLALQVRQKVSAVWSLAAVGISMAAVFMGAFAAIRGSIVITPSLMRRWRMEDIGGFFEPYEIKIPLRLLPEEVEAFMEYFTDALKALEGHPIKCTSSIKRLPVVDNIERIDFIYKAPTSTVANFYTKNSLLLRRIDEEEVGVLLKSSGDQEWAYVAGSLVRMITMRWSTTRG